MTTNSDHAPRDQGSTLAGKYMTFRLASEEYGLEILKVRELIGFMEITRIPRAPSHVRGVINLRGKVIPVVDLRLKFEMAATDPTSQTVIIVVQLGPKSAGLTMGILVDEVLEVRAIAAGDIEPPPNLSGRDGAVVRARRREGRQTRDLSARHRSCAHARGASPLERDHGPCRGRSRHSLSDRAFSHPA